MIDYVQFLQAAAKGDVATLVALLDAGADPNWIHPHVGHTALYNASTSDKSHAVRVLLERGADANLRMNYHSPVDGRKENGVVALMYARSPDVVRALVSGGADVNAADGNGLTSLIRACHWGKYEVVKALLDAGAHSSLKTTNGRTAGDVAAVRIEDYRSMADGETTMRSRNVSKPLRI
jgi:uncharacterized protein